MTVEQNLELHSLVIAAASEGTVPESLLAADFHLEHHTSAVTDHSYRGPSGWRDWNRDLFEEFCCGASLVVEAVLAADDDLVVATVCISGTSVHTEAPIEFRWTEVTWFTDGIATRAVGFCTPEQALSLAGAGEGVIAEVAPHATPPNPGDGPRRVTGPAGDGCGPPIATHPRARRQPARRFARGRFGLRAAGLRVTAASSWLPARSLWA